MSSKIRPYLVLVRAGTLFSPAADVIAGACLVASSHGGAAAGIWTLTLLRMALASVLLYAAGMILNDHADRELDAVQRPERPIPRGQIPASTALVLGACAILCGLVLSPVPIYHGVMAALNLGYDYVIKTTAFAGALTMGTLRAMNLLVPLAATSAISTGRPIAVWFAATAYFLYILCVTLLGILEDADRVQRRAVLGLISVPPIACLLVIYNQPVPWPATAAAIALAGLFLWRHRNVEWNQGTIRGAMMWLLLGTMPYTALLALSNGQSIAAAVIIVMLFAARRVAKHIALT